MKQDTSKPTHEVYYLVPGVLNVINCHLQLHKHAKYIQASHMDFCNTLNSLPRAKQLINFMGLLGDIGKIRIYSDRRHMGTFTTRLSSALHQQEWHLNLSQRNLLEAGKHL